MRVVDSNNREPELEFGDRSDSLCHGVDVSAWYRTTDAGFACKALLRRLLVFVAVADVWVCDALIVVGALLGWKGRDRRPWIGPAVNDDVVAKPVEPPLNTWMHKGIFEHPSCGHVSQSSTADDISGNMRRHRRQRSTPMLAAYVGVSPQCMVLRRGGGHGWFIGRLR